MAGIVHLMYHELNCEGRELCHSEPGYFRYAVEEVSFRGQLSLLQRLQYRGLNVSQALTVRPSEAAVAITFDDGCETDLLAAAPLLQEFGFGATFYIVSGFIGQPGYLSPTQLRELAGMGFEIGCHSRTHPNLATLDAAGLHREIVVAKREIEDILSQPIKHFSCPRGFWSSAAAHAASDAGFVTMATSRIGFNHTASDPYRLARIAMYRGTTLRDFERVCTGKGIRMRRGAQWFLDQSKSVLGESSYRWVRTNLLVSRGSETRLFPARKP